MKHARTNQVSHAERAGRATHAETAQRAGRTHAAQRSNTMTKRTLATTERRLLQELAKADKTK